MPLEACFSSCPISALSTKPLPNADYFPHQQEVFHSFMKTIFSTVKLKKAALAGLLVLVLASSLCQMLLPAFLSQMISRGVAAGADSVILIYGTVMAGITVLSCIISFQPRLFPRISQHSLGQRSFPLSWNFPPQRWITSALPA